MNFALNGETYSLPTLSENGNIMPPKPSEKGTRVSSSQEENLRHVDASDAILKDIQNKPWKS